MRFDTALSRERTPTYASSPRVPRCAPLFYFSLTRGCCSGAPSLLIGHCGLAAANANVDQTKTYHAESWRAESRGEDHNYRGAGHHAERDDADCQCTRRGSTAPPRKMPDGPSDLRRLLSTTHTIRTVPALPATTRPVTLFSKCPGALRKITRYKRTLDDDIRWIPPSNDGPGTAIPHTFA